MKDLALKSPKAARSPVPYGVVASILLLTSFFTTATSFAGRPLVIDDATPVSRSDFELELGFGHSQSHDGSRDQNWPVLNLSYGVFDEMEVGLAIQRINKHAKDSSATRGFEDLHLSTKWKFRDEGELCPALALGFDLRLPTANRRKGLSPGRTDETFLLIATKTWSPVRVHLNAGYSIVNHSSNDKLKNRVRGGTAFEWTIHPQWTLVGELFGISREIARSKNRAEFQLGVRYFLTEQLVVDSAIGRSLLSSGTAIQATAGLTWTINLHKLLGQAP
jgi:hypothetical protein